MSNAQPATCMVQGRIVYVIGDLFAGDQAKIYGTQAPKMNKQGQPYREYGFGLAVPKQLIGQRPDDIWAKIHEVAFGVFPSRQIPANFHMKWKDGDTGTNQDGSPLNVKEGYPGHVVFNLKTTFPVKFIKTEVNPDGSVQHTQVSDGIKCGDYVNVQVSIGVHSGANAGLYLNPLMVQFVKAGKEISNAPSAFQVFGSVAPQAPAWANTEPTQPSFPVQAATPPPAPHHGVLPHQFQPQQQGNGFAPAPSPAMATGFTQGAASPGPVAPAPMPSPAAAFPQSNGMPPLPGFNR